MRYLSLFSGIGGDMLAAERAGFELAGSVELDDWCRGILRKHWPDLPQWSDVKTLDPTGDWPFGTVDVIGGGFPCQPFSVAGQQKGEADDRNLWPEVGRLIRAVRPRGVFLENVAALLADPYFGTIVGDLAACGYDAEWDCVPAAAIGAPHRRDRVWIVAYPSGVRRDAGRAEQSLQGPGPHGETRLADSDSSGRIEHGPQPASTQQPAAERGGSISNPNSVRLEGPELQRGIFQQCAWTRDESWWRVEPNVGRVADGVPQRVDRLRGLGNALVPQVAEPILRALRERLEG